MKKLFCLFSALELFCCLPLLKTVLLSAIELFSCLFLWKTVTLPVNHLQNATIFTHEHSTVPLTMIRLCLGGSQAIEISVSEDIAFKLLGGSGTTDSSRSATRVFSAIHDVAGPVPLTVMAASLIW